ncbi:hypothetical protein BST61_g5138 [Cercospora zeina]
MEIIHILMFMITASAVVVRYVAHPQPGALIPRIPQASSLATLLEDSSSSSSSTAFDIPAAITGSSSPSALTSGIGIESQQLTITDTPTSTCIPISTCVDKISICPDRSRKRYGGCYDKNFCDGNTSPYPIPTC